MNAADFELNVSLPADARFAKAMGGLAAHAARYAGGGEDLAEGYGEAVERIVLACLDAMAAGAAVPVVLRRGAGPVEFLIGCNERFDPGRFGTHITIDWTGDRGASMCRVALELDP